MCSDKFQRRVNLFIVNINVHIQLCNVQLSSEFGRIS